MTERKNLHKYASISKRFVVPSFFQILHKLHDIVFSHLSLIVYWMEQSITLSEICCCVGESNFLAIAVAARKTTRSYWWWWWWC